jgi:hypothetical protein
MPGILAQSAETAVSAGGVGAEPPQIFILHKLSIRASTKKVTPKNFIKVQKSFGKSFFGSFSTGVPENNRITRDR